MTRVLWHGGKNLLSPFRSLPEDGQWVRPMRSNRVDVAFILEGTMGSGVYSDKPGQPSKGERVSNWTAVQVLLELSNMGHGAPQTPEALLEKALTAGSPALRAKYATHGLRQPVLGRDTHVLLLRQLYLAHLEREHFAEARGVAEQMVALGDLTEPALHDAARACLAQRDYVAAAGHLRVAARSAPAQRRALHLWTLGRALYLNEQYEEAQNAFQRALRWTTENQSLYRAHAALSQWRRQQRRGQPSVSKSSESNDVELSDLREHYAQLSRLDPLPLYAEFLAAELLREVGERSVSLVLLRRFVEQAERATTEIAVGLRAEIAIARGWLSESTDDSGG